MAKQVKKSVKTASNNQQAVTTTTALVPFMSIQMNLDLDKIDPSPFNTNRSIGEEELSSLAQSIGRMGVQVPIKVRPKDGGRYELIFGERRWRASQLAGKDKIRAEVEAMSDEQAKTCLLIENLQRQNYTPLEEAEIFFDLLQNDGLNVAQICERFSLKENYVRRRITLVNLIPEVSAMLQAKDISLEIAIEFAKYDHHIQQEVYSERFSDDGPHSWRGIKAKEFAKLLYRKYMTLLENFHFDKTECDNCMHNTLNQTLFKECSGECAACQNRECLQAKNNVYLVDHAIELAQSDPYIHLSYTKEASTSVIDTLTERGYEVVPYVYSYYNEVDQPIKPDPIDPDDYDDAEDLMWAEENHLGELAYYEEELEEFQQAISEGKVLKYAVIKALQITFAYVEVPQVTETKDDQTFTVAPSSPKEELINKDKRNKEICYEHIVQDLQKVIPQLPEDFPRTEITERESHLLSYVLLHRMQSCYLRCFTEESWLSDEKMMQLAEEMSPEDRNLLFRLTILTYCSNLSNYSVNPERQDIKFFTEVSDLYVPDESKSIREKYETVYEKRHAKLQERIDALEKESELRRLKLIESPLLNALPESTSIVEGTVIDTATGEILESADIVQTVEAEEIIPEQTSSEIHPMLTLLPLRCESSEQDEQSEEIDYPEPDIDPAPEQEEEEPVRWWEEESDDDPELLFQKDPTELPLRCESSEQGEQFEEIDYPEPDIDPAPEQEEEELARWWEEESDDDPELLLQEDLSDTLGVEELMITPCTEHSVESNREAA